MRARKPGDGDRRRGRVFEPLGRPRGLPVPVPGVSVAVVTVVCSGVCVSLICLVTGWEGVAAWSGWIVGTVGEMSLGAGAGGGTGAGAGV